MQHEIYPDYIKKFGSCSSENSTSSSLQGPVYRVLSDNNMKSMNTLWAHDRLFGKASSICSSHYGLKGYIHKMCLYVLQ